MKKYLLALLTLMVSTVMMAGSPFTVKSGNVPAMKDSKVYVEYDLSKMVVLDEDSKKEMSMHDFCKLKGDDWVRDEGKDDVDAQSTFTEKLGKKAKFDVVSDKSTADYTIVVQPTKFSYGNPFAFGAFMSNDVKGFMIANIIIKDKSGATVAELAMKKVNPSGQGYNWTHQKCQVYEKAAKELASYLK